MADVVFTLYNYASNQREEYLLLKLFKTALEEEIECVPSCYCPTTNRQLLALLHQDLLAYYWL